ncbi:ras-related protein Rab-9B isoform X1 [Microplitis demolitor]|uniref:ras-related protein Rab-9B isoform X1 n=2 Tax=Microplitis demolitor TaxID=69319 RepID=UPI0004CD61F5|nr:ras-related protein Rab-9B isoform X1 [Microplitis demolitor]XP_008555741.1 ras-related protein Rab-9B isoform X1 [Microplitis demolitor]
MSGSNSLMATSPRSGTAPNRNSQKSTLLKVVILGDGGVGKSCLMNRFVSNHFDEHSFHTIGVEFLNKDIEINGEAYTLQIWDTAGQERFKTLRTPFYRGSDICLLTYAIDDRTSFRNLALWRSEFLYYADVQEGSLFPFIVVGNKVDVAETDKQITTEEARAWCAENGNPPLVETSAKNATNVEAAFGAAVAAWAKLEAKLERPIVEDTIDLSKQHSPQRSSCCMPLSSSE